MESDTGQMKDCPSCGSQIPEESLKCGLCKSPLGRCAGCKQWIVEGTKCLDCGKTTVRIKAVAKKPAAEPEAMGLEFRGTGPGLLPPLAARFLLVAAGLFTAVSAAGAAGLAPVARFLSDRGLEIRQRWPALAVASAAFFVLAVIAGGFLRRYRMTRTLVSGKPVEIESGVGSWIATVMITLFVLPLTAGLGLPWIYARTVRSFYRRCLWSRKNLEFTGTGDEVLGRLALTLLLFPFALATGGFLFGAVSWMWFRWEHGNLHVPDPNGVAHRVRFRGTFGAFYVRWAVGWLVTLATAGLARPWVRAAEWRWIARETEIPSTR
jgi:hypothetical protein